MKSIFVIALYTIKQTLKKKIFWITNILLAIFIMVVISYVDDSEFISSLLSSNNMSYNNGVQNISLDTLLQSLDSVTAEDSNKILIYDKTEIFTNYLMQKSGSDALFIFDNSSTIEDIRTKISNDELYAFALIDNNDGIISFNYIVKEKKPEDASIAELLANIFKKIQIEVLLENENVSPEVISQMSSSISYTVEGLKSDKLLEASSFVSIFVSFLLFFTIYLYGYGVSTSIASEKSSKIIETLVTSTTPKSIIIGKTIGTGILGILQLVFLLLVAFISCQSFLGKELAGLSDMVTSIDLSFMNLFLLFIYFILGYSLYAFINSIAGAIVGKPEDIQIVNMPISLISLVSFYISLFGSNVNNEDLYLFACVFPFSSSFAMPGRILTGIAKTSEILASLFILIISLIVLIFFAIRIYSTAILRYGNRMKFKDLINIFIKIN